MRRTTKNLNYESLVSHESIVQRAPMLKTWLTRYSLPGSLDQNKVANFVSTQLSNIYVANMVSLGHLTIAKDALSKEQNHSSKNLRIADFNLQIVVEEMDSLEQKLFAWQTFWEEMKE